MAEDVKVEAAPPTWADECLKASTLADAHQQEVIAELIELEFKVEEAAKAGDIALADEFINVIKILRPFVAIPF